MKPYLVFLTLLTNLTLYGQVTELDRAYQDIQNDEPNLAGYYNLFLQSAIYIPTHDLPEGIQGEHKARKGESFTPIIITLEDRQYLLLFDTLERLQQYVKRETGYVKLTGASIAQTMPGNLYWALNYTTDYYKEFSPEEIQRLKENLASSPETTAVKEEPQALIEAPTKVPQGLMEALTQVCLKNKAVKAAYLGQVTFQAPREIPRLTLIVDTKGVEEDLRGALLKEFDATSQRFLGDANFMTILIDRRSEVSLAMKDKIRPFYTN